MILPILAYGDPILRKQTRRVAAGDLELKALVENMFETMYHAHGVGLAAPQIGRDLRLFVIDLTPFAEGPENKALKGFKRVFVNAEKAAEKGPMWKFNEGCLSIPDISEDIVRPSAITLEYEDVRFNRRRETFEGLAARVIQHEYDHTQGVLFTDKLSPLKKRLLKNKLTNIAKGKVAVDYPMKFSLGKKVKP